MKKKTPSSKAEKQNNNDSKESKWKSVHDFFYGLLVTPFFRSIGNTFSHGAVHFIALLVFGALTAWLFYRNNTIDIRPHNIGFDLQWTNKLKVWLPAGSIELTDSIRNLEINLELNSQESAQKTDSRYSNRLVFHFDGNHLITYPEKNDTLWMVTRPINQGKEDSIAIKIFSDPIFSDFEVDVSSEEIIITTAKEQGREMTMNKKSSRLEIVYPGESFYFVPDSDTTRYVYQRENNDSLLSIKIMPNEYDVDGHGKMKAPRQTVCVYSNSFGVDDDNPYYYYFLAFPSVKLAGSFKLDFKVADLTEKSDFNIKYAKDKHLQYNYVFPQPDIINNGYIEYHTKEKMEEIKKNHGVIIQAVDVETLNKQNSQTFLYSVLVGTGLAFLLDIFIQLIRELRRVNAMYRKKEGK